jgi:DNA-binding response OmpR family regulator
MDDKQSNATSQTPSVLVVDDVSKNLQVLVNILREKEYKISVADSGQKALEMMDRFIPDIILLDIMMPGMNGFQVCEKLKSSDKTKNIPVIFLTARTETEDVVKGFQMGAVDYVTKPFNKAELLARVHTHLELKTAQKEIIQLEQKNAVLAAAVTANHEINQPLTVLQGNFELFNHSLDQEGLTDKQRRFITRMQESMEKIAAILKKFRDSTSIRFEDYIEGQKMVVFEE